MANLAQALKQEIVRLARKEVKEQVEGTKKASARHRREIAALKRSVRSLREKVAFLEGEEKKRIATSATKSVPSGTRFQRRGLKAHRAKLGLSAKDYGRLVGVGHLTIYSWEKGESRPRPDKLGTLAEVRKLGKREAQRRLEMLR